MFVAPISNTNFNGKIKNTKALMQVLEHADKATLERFNVVTERATKVDDKMVYNLNLHNFSKTDSPFFIGAYTLSKTDTVKEVTEHIGKKDVRYYYSSLENCNEQSNSVLKTFISVLEDLYPINSNNSKSELLDKIIKRLV